MINNKMNWLLQKSGKDFLNIKNENESIAKTFEITYSSALKHFNKLLENKIIYKSGKRKFHLTEKGKEIKWRIEEIIKMGGKK